MKSWSLVLLVLFVICAACCGQTAAQTGQTGLGGLLSSFKSVLGFKSSSEGGCFIFQGGLLMWFVLCGWMKGCVHVGSARKLF